jgi:hypothetical protein
VHGDYNNATPTQQQLQLQQPVKHGEKGEDTENTENCKRGKVNVGAP